MLRAALNPEKKKLNVAADIKPPARAKQPAPIQRPEPTPSAAPAQSWAEIIEAASLSGLAYELASHCVLLENRNALLRLQLGSEQAHLQKPRFVERLTAALSHYYQQPVRLQFEQRPVQNAPQGETPAQQRQRLVKERQQAAERAIAEDANVQALRQQFGAEVVAGSIRPRDE